ncbi:MAG: YciI family protein [Actinobacteria bacterium]|nr:MAG: YciI family protein [Actinomycetota bacterium]
MQFMALIYADEGAWETLTDEERQSVYARYQSLAEDARAAGVMRGGDELASTRDATTVRIREGQTLVVDGPYAETKERLGGYFLFECASIDEAVDWAARIPAAEHGAVEVRPVYFDPAEA